MDLRFEPFPFFSGCHSQTILGSYLHLSYFFDTSQRLFVELPDGDRIALEITTPSGWTPASPTVIMVHGLCGSHRSPYLIRLTKKLQKRNIRAIRMNMRGCGSGRGHAKNMYHSGRSEDIHAVLLQLKAQNPASPLILVGFSLGANQVLKWAGEQGQAARDLCQSVIAVSPPADIYSSVQRLQSPGNELYERYFIAKLKQNVHDLHHATPGLPRVQFPKTMSLYEFDEHYTAPLCGFVNAMDYYYKSSAVTVAKGIALPCTVLFAKDDPIIAHDSLDHIQEMDGIRIFKTEKGGHLGFLANPLRCRCFHWMERALLEWI